MFTLSVNRTKQFSEFSQFIRQYCKEHSANLCFMAGVYETKDFVFPESGMN